MKNRIIIVCLILLTTGCTCQYNLNIKNDKIHESIVSIIDNSEIPASDDLRIMGDIEIDDQIKPFIENDQFPFMDNQNIKYHKKVLEKDDTTTVTLNYDYKFDEYKKSKAYNCFEKKVFYENNGVHNLNLSGKFYCFYGDEITINVKTDYIVKSNNADRVENGVYTWIIGEKNSNNANIEFSFTDRKTEFNYVIILVIITLSIAVGFMILSYVRKKYNSSNQL